MLLVLLLYFFYALAFVAAKGVVEYIQPIFFIGIRMVAAGVILYIYQWVRYPALLKVRRQDIFDFFQVAFLNIFFAYAVEFWAIQYISASKTSLIFNLTPFLTAGMAYFVINEQLTKRQWVGLMIGFLGIIPVLFNQQADEHNLSHFGFLSTAEIGMLLAVAALAYTWIILKKLVTTRSYSPVTVNGITMIVGGVFSFIAAGLFEKFPYVYVSDAYTTYYAIGSIGAYLAILIITANLISYNLYGYLLKRYTATFLSLAGLITPLFTAALDWIWLGERVGITFFVSMAIVCLGLGIFYQDEK